MEYVYAALLIHKSGGKISEASVKKVLEAAGAKPDDARIKALVAGLEGVDIEKAIEKASVAPVVVAAAPAGGEANAEKKEEKKVEKKSEEEAAAGLGALFG